MVHGWKSIKVWVLLIYFYNFNIIPIKKWASWFLKTIWQIDYRIYMEIQETLKKQQSTLAEKKNEATEFKLPHSRLAIA